MLGPAPVGPQALANGKHDSAPFILHEMLLASRDSRAVHRARKPHRAASPNSKPLSRPHSCTKRDAMVASGCPGEPVVASLRSRNLRLCSRECP